MWYVVITLDWNILLNLDLVDGSQDGQSVANADNSHFLEFIV